MTRLLLHTARRLRRISRYEQCASIHTSAQVSATAAAQKAKPEQPKAAPPKPDSKPPPPPPPPPPPAGASSKADAKAEEKPPPSPKVVKLAKELSDLSVMEFTDLTELLKKKLGLDSANITVPMMMPAGMMMPGMVAGAPGAPAAGAAAAAPAAEEKPVEKQVFDVKLEKYEAADKIKVIKEVRAFTELGLKEAKELVEKLPVVVKKSVTKDEGNKILEKLKAVGGVAVLE